MLFRCAEMDVNANGALSLAEIDKAVVAGTVGRALHCPDFDHKPALMRAYKAADASGKTREREREREREGAFPLSAFLVCFSLAFFFF